MDHQPANDFRSLGEAAARSMLSFYRAIGFPTTLAQLDGYDSRILPKVLENAKNPQLSMKLKSMPVALNLETVDEYMGLILKAAESGNLGLIKNLDRK
ncbi:MAG: hypothetical protein U5N58_13490 [Actinomycetota bacterium]|nr:hypothetical protein [Actinomycetota bacterium]